MPTPPTVYLIAGDDEFLVKEAAARKATELAPKDAGPFGVEIIEGDAANGEEALGVVRRLEAAFQERALFSRQKLVWWKNTNLLAAEVPGGESTLQALSGLNELLRRGLPDGVTLLVSAIGFDRRRTLAKTLEKTGQIELFLVREERTEETEERIETFITERLVAEKKRFADERARWAFRELVEPSLREMANELEKLCLYVGQRTEITESDVRTICSASRQAVIWELVDAIGQRNLLKATAALKNLLEQGEAGISVVAMLATQFRLMLLARDLMEQRLLPPTGRYADYAFAFKRLPDAAKEHFPRSKDGALPNEWRFGRAATAAHHFTRGELIGAMERLLEAHLQLVGSQLNEAVVLQETITRIVRK